jgi:hypothetical protein
MPGPRQLRDDRTATDGIRASGWQCPVRHSHADGRLGLPAGEGAGSRRQSDQRLVTTHCRFCEGALTLDRFVVLISHAAAHQPRVHTNQS